MAERIWHYINSWGPVIVALLIGQFFLWTSNINRKIDYLETHSATKEDLVEYKTATDARLLEFGKLMYDNKGGKPDETL
ncbi:MAG: hypothetical protein DRH06_00025 [Deltaproteobacteria bacterium]|nr:MAG: hypothetical protein DRH06_00025 [Deltaproteobacteria bacterium]